MCLNYHTTYTSCGHTVIMRGDATCIWSYHLDDTVCFTYCTIYNVRMRTFLGTCRQPSCLLAHLPFSIDA